jgi:hypothetical protein
MLTLQDEFGSALLFTFFGRVTEGFVLILL